MASLLDCGVGCRTRRWYRSSVVLSDFCQSRWYDASNPKVRFCACYNSRFRSKFRRSSRVFNRGGGYGEFSWSTARIFRGRVGRFALGVCPYVPCVIKDRPASRRELHWFRDRRPACPSSARQSARFSYQLDCRNYGRRHYPVQLLQTKLRLLRQQC